MKCAVCENEIKVGDLCMMFPDGLYCDVCCMTMATSFLMNRKSKPQASELPSDAEKSSDVISNMRSMNKNRY